MPSSGSLQRTGSDIVISGFIDKSVVDRFRVALKEGDTRPERVIFDHSTGGHQGPSATLAVLIELNRLSTVARHQCSSGCALAFVAGRVREVDTANGPVILAFHNASSADGRPTERPDDIVRRLDRYTSRRLNGQYREIVRSSFGDSALAFYFAPDGDTVSSDQVRHCMPGSGRDFEKCKLLTDISAVQLGVVDKRRTRAE